MAEVVRLRVDGREVEVPAGTAVSAAVLNVGQPVLRRSVTDEPRGPVCGMGVCFECRVTIDGCAHVRSCTVTCRSGMEVVTGA